MPINIDKMSIYVLIAIGILCLLLLFLWCSVPSPYRVVEREFSHLEKNLKTGDMILFSSSGVIEGVIKLYNSTPITHCAIVFVDVDGWYGPRNDVYLLENHPNSMYDHYKHRKSGLSQPTMVRLIDKLSNYHGTYLHLSLNVPVSNIKDLLLSKHEQLASRDFIFDPYSWLNNKDMLYTCTDYCYDMLRDVLPCIDRRIYSPDEFLNLSCYTPSEYFTIRDV